MKALDDFPIPREFYGYDIFRKPNFNLPDNLAFKGFKNSQLSSLKLKPVVNIEFETLRPDVYKQLNSFDPKSVAKSKSKYPQLYKYYCERSRSRIIKSVHSLKKKKVNKRKKKENHKKLLESEEYQANGASVTIT